MTKSNDGTGLVYGLVGAAVFGAASFVVGAAVNGPTPRPEKYDNVTVNQAFYSNKPVQVEGKIINVDYQKEGLFRDADINITLKDSLDAEIKCEVSDGIAAKLNPSHRHNSRDNDKIKDAYDALTRNNVNRDGKIIVSGRMHENKLEAYELTINGTKYVLLRK